MAEPEGFEETLDRLEESRAAAEAAYFADLEELRGRVARLQESAAEAASAAGDGSGAVVPIALPLASEFGVSGRGGTLSEAQPWPSGGGWFRQRLNAMSRWLLRDYLNVLDRRHDALVATGQLQQETLVETIEALRPLVDELRQADARLRDAIAAGDAANDDRAATGFDALREALNRAVETVDVIAGTCERLRLLGDAKDAETLQRATHGPQRKMEVMFDEFGRQQEALLAELVGRRQDLDRLIEKVGALGER